MSDFNSWEEIQEYLQDSYNFVFYHVWNFSRVGMSCSDENECCACPFKNIEEAMESLKDYAKSPERVSKS